ncbi:MAG TPA: M20/M25/M40 family metallo-hydrolase, partial [Planctomycetota bacterium]|nr:M20/M25/M40 family metallo-hydrolase [Planctomycetota bacterium]
LFNHVMPPYGPEGSGYGDASRFRGRGPARAAKLGAVAAMVRSLTARSLRSPHTGNTSFREDDKRIPAVAISTEDADYLARLVGAGETRVRLEVATRNDPKARSANVVGELRGREKPDEIVVLGAHLDSWDVGQGAHDDGAGCVMAMQAITLLRKLDLRPRRTIRVVLFTDEESGLEGAKTYGKTHAAELGSHVAAIETDSGGFRPVGFSVETGPQALAGAVALAARIGPLLEPVGAGKIDSGHGGADIGVLGREGVPLFGFNVEGSRYFDYHHSQADTLDKVDRADLALGAGVLAVMAYVLADQPETLPRAPTPPPERPE